MPIEVEPNDGKTLIVRGKMHLQQYSLLPCEAYKLPFETFYHSSTLSTKTHYASMVIKFVVSSLYAGIYTS